MKYLTLKFPGRFEDAFLYMGRLVIITENHSIRIYDMEDIVNQLQEDRAFLDLPTLLFFRNDLTEDPKFTQRLRNKSRKNDLINAFNNFKSASVYIDDKFGEPTEWNIDISDDILLDLNIYNGRIYIGTSAGLYHLDLDWESEEITQIGTIQKRLDTKCVYTTAKCGTVNASCASDGCFSFVDDFNLGGDEFHREMQISESSLRTSWLDYDIVNYATAVSPSLYNSIRTAIPQEVDEAKKNLETEEYIITDFIRDQWTLNSLFENSKFNGILNLENIQFVQNSNQALFIRTYEGDLYTLSLQKESTRNPSLARYNRYTGLNHIVSSIHTIRLDKGGTIIETDENILLFARKHFIPIFDGEVISIRTFPRSKHYQRLVSVTTADEVILIAIFDDEV